MNNASELFRQLPGLPGEGPAPLQFTATGQGSHREGFVIEFHPPSRQPWVGNFQPGLAGFSTVVLHPDGRSVVVISGGQAYQIDPESQSIISQFGGGIAGCMVIPTRSMLVMSDDIRLWALQPAGIAWQTERISWDGIRSLTVSGSDIAGEAYDPMTDSWTPFSVSLDSGRVTGGSYGAYFT
jgi:hypothetical protein